MTTKKAYQQDQIRSRYRGWQLIATRHSVTGLKGKGGEMFEIAKLKDIEMALRLGKQKIDRLEGEQVWPVEAANN